MPAPNETPRANEKTEPSAMSLEQLRASMQQPADLPAPRLTLAVFLLDYPAIYEQASTHCSCRRHWRRRHRNDQDPRKKKFSLGQTDLARVRPLGRQETQIQRSGHHRDGADEGLVRSEEHTSELQSLRH